jgi:uncharacterized protein YbjT (DUF2867 family)
MKIGGILKSYENQDLYCTDLSSRPNPGLGKILVTGATGYIGGRLVPELLARGYNVRIMVRVPTQNLKDQWPKTEIVVADAVRQDELFAALEGIHTAYYLIHSLLLGPRQFEAADLQAAINFRTAAKKMDVKRIIYLGGLGDIQTTLSPHLRSRIRIAQELQMGSVPVTIMRAAIIIGSGSASYEIIEHLIRNMPVILIPPWARTRCQPIAVRDVIKYLVGVLEVPETAGKSFDIGGSEILSYETMLRTLTEILGRKRLFVPIFISNIKVLAYFTSLFTPVPQHITRSLMESSFNEVICSNDEIKKFLPFEPIPFREALVRALSREEQDRVSTRWSDAYPPAYELAIKLHEVTPAPNFSASYSLLTAKNKSDLFRSICMIGGKEGWFDSNWMWKLRGMVDRIMLGVGSSRGRRSQSSLRINDVIDFWRVEDMVEDTMLLLRAEMKLPGKAWLQFTIDSRKDRNILSVKAFYQTSTMLGKMYWYLFLPFHHFIFSDLIYQIEKRS